jgi:heptosyltransferase-2
MEKILIIQTAFIGDAILTLPMIQTLKKMNPDSEIHVVCIPSTEEIFSASPSVHSIKILDKRNKHKSVFALNSFAKDLKKENYNRIYSPHRSVRTGLLVMLTGIRESYGFSNSSLKHVYKNLIEYHPDHHEVRRNLDLIEFNYTGDQWRILPEIRSSREDKTAVSNYAASIRLKNRYICIAPGSVWNTKIYPKEYLKEVIKYILENYDYDILLIGGKNDESLSSQISSEFSSKVYSASGKFTLIQSIELLKGAELLITNDSAPTHLAMCADIPVITIYCSTVADFGFYPYNKNSSYLSYDDLFCKPCGIHGYMKCPIGTFECAYNLKPVKVIEKVKGLLNDKIKGL